MEVRGFDMFRCKCCGAINRAPTSRPDGAVAKCGSCHSLLDLSGAPQSVDAAALAQTLCSSPVPVLVDFWTPQCQSEESADRMIDRVAREHAGAVITLTLNAEAEPVPAIVHGIRRLLARDGTFGLPTFVLFKRGREVAPNRSFGQR
jgi:thioredoxin 2